jgi:hypothetical protein
MYEHLSTHLQSALTADRHARLRREAGSTRRWRRT